MARTPSRPTVNSRPTGQPAAEQMASMTETYTFNVYRNAQAVVKLRNEFKVQILDTPKDFFPEFVQRT